MTAKPRPTRCRRPSQIPRGDSRPTTSIRRREPNSPTRRSASSCARSEFSRSRSGVSRRSSSMRASTLTFVNGWAQAGPHGLRIAGRRPSSWTLGGRGDMAPYISWQDYLLSPCGPTPPGCASGPRHRRLPCLVNVTFKRPRTDTVTASRIGAGSWEESHGRHLVCRLLLEKKNNRTQRELEHQDDMNERVIIGEECSH